MATGAIVAVSPSSVIATPSANLFNYAYCAAANKAYIGTLNGITSQPVFVGKINNGAGALTIDIDHYPSELTFGNLIRVTYPSGQVAGWWKFEGKKAVLAKGNAYTLTLTPLSAELSDISFNANYSSDATQPTIPLGAATFDVPIRAAIARTLHLSAGNISNDGTSYSYVFNNCTGQDPLKQAMTFAGSSWWYYCDASGVVSVANASPFAHSWTIGTDVVAGEWDDDILTLWNGQPVTGGTGPDGVTSLSAFAQDTNPANPYSVPNLGERTNAVYQDTSLNTQASVNAVAASLLNYAERVTSTRKLTISHYSLRRPQPGDACYLTEVSAGDPAKPGNLSKDGPFLITDVTEYGGSFRYDVTISASMTVPVLSFNPMMSQQQAIAKLMQNPQVLAVSPSGAVGNIGNGVVGGGAFGSVRPSVPTGLALVTSLDNVGQLNNAAISATWNGNSSTEGVAYYALRWRKATDPDVDASYTSQHVTAQGAKISGLYQGTAYVVELAAVNGAGVSSASWATVGITSAMDTNAPAVPINLAATRTPRGAQVSWSPGVETAGGAAADLQGYWLQVSIPGITNGWQDVTGNTKGYALNTSVSFVAPKGTPQGSVITFRVAAVDWSGNVSAFTQQIPAIFTDGVTFDELQVGQLNVYGLLSAQGGLSTRSEAPNGALSGVGVDVNASGIVLYDGTVTDHGAGAGVTAKLNATNGNAFFSGTVSASQIQALQGGASGSGARMWADFVDNTPGIGPLLDVNDGIYDRVQIGNLSGLPNSPAQYGLRAVNSSGTAIFDSLGLIAAATNAGSGSAAAVALATSPTNTWLGAAATAVTFAVINHQTNVLIMCFGDISASVAASTQWPLYCSMYVVGQGFYNTIRVNFSNFSGVTEAWDAPLAVAAVLNLPVGTYTAELGYFIPGGYPGGGTVNTSIFAFQLGS